MSHLPLPPRSGHPGGGGGRPFSGFTLVEVLIVVAILGILSAFAYPAYSEHVARGRRSGAQAGLMEAAQWMQRYYSALNTYKDADKKIPDSYKSLPRDGGAKTYSLEVTVGADERSYTLTATPVSADSKCGKLTITDLGQKGSEHGDVPSCWR